MIEFFQQSKSCNAGNFYTHVRNISLCSGIVNNTDKFISSMIKCIAVFTPFNAIIEYYLDSKSTELFCDTRSFFQSLTTNKLFEDRVPDKPFDGQTAPDSPWGYASTNFHQRGIAHAFEKKSGPF